MNKKKVLKEEKIMSMSKEQCMEYVEELTWNLNYKQLMEYFENRKNDMEEEMNDTKTVLWIDGIDMFPMTIPLFPENQIRKTSVLRKLLQRLIHMFCK